MVARTISPPASDAPSGGIPTPPAGVALVIRAANDPSFSLADLARLIEREPSLTVNLLRWGNSAAYGSGREIRSVGQAAVMLGARTLRNLAVAHVVTTMRTRIDTGAFDAKLFWEDSLRRACAALVLARTAGYEDPSEAFTVGLIQDLGLLVTVTSHRDQTTRLQAVRGAPGVERIRTEVDISGRSHSEHFVALARSWGLPRDLVDAVCFHHSDTPVTADRRTTRLAQLARAADLVADVAQTCAVGDTIMRARSALTHLESRKPLVLDAIVDAVTKEMEVQSAGLEINISEQPSFESLMQRANDALVQISYSYEELTQRLETLLREKDELARKLAHSNAALQRLATTDPLTNVGNRRSFSEAMSAALAEAATEGTEVSLIMLDLDHFKHVNDTYGHQSGDDVLVAVAERLTANVRPCDIIGRLGGEEFGVILPRCGPIGGEGVAERLRAALSGTPIRCRDGTELAVTGSFGGLTVHQQTSGDEALKLVDQAMYKSKLNGRDRVTWLQV